MNMMRKDIMSQMNMDHGMDGPSGGDHGRDDRDRRDGPSMPENECAMNQRMRLDGSCQTCKAPYVQSQDGGMDCEFVGMRRYGEDTYYGRLRNNKQYGKGLYVWGKSNNSYYGLWLNGLKHGMGIKEFKNGSRYMGEWRDDKMEGQGEYSFKSGKVY
jgi:hypothetical protein